MSITKQALQDKILQGIPISRDMAFTIDHLDDHSITVRGGGQQNINVHQTAFAGSLYCMCTLAVWGLVNSRLPDNASLVMANASIDYLKPVKGDIVANAGLSEAQIQSFLDNLHSDGKARLEAMAMVNNEQQTAVKFTAVLYARLC